MTRPSYNQFSTDITNYIALALENFAKKFQTCIPAIVKEVKSREEVVVSPAVLQTASDGSAVEWANVTTTVLTPFSNGLFLSMPVSVGDTGWLVGADLDTNNFKETKKAAQQTVFNRHRYQFGFFVPDAVNGYQVSNDDDGAIVLSNTDGTTKIVIKDKEINLVSSKDLKINAQNVSIVSSGNSVTIDGVNFAQHTHLSGGLTAGDVAVTGITGGVNV